MNKKKNSNKKIILNYKSKLNNFFLVSMPFMEDHIFNDAVIYIYKHDKDGALGIIINKITNINIEILLNNFKQEEKDKIFANLKSINNFIMFGGIVKTEKSFILYTKKKKNPKTLKIKKKIIFLEYDTFVEKYKHNNLKIENLIITFGYLKWGPGQLEREISNKVAWILMREDEDLLFKTPVKKRYKKLLSTLGIKKIFLSNVYDEI
ncbi:YqgE/AlgH family protein [Candidatus Zinderia endosymbiont of Aphrophora alni]|uniref:YqgE/AlgH family protein n=1 Tax=Candidatus Zinderia endosymbiont of Aphrophora alni TaxID=3077951 RepID=UPI0030CC4291